VAGVNVSNVATRIIVGRKTKWFVVGFWVVLIFGMGSLAGKLSGAQKNDTKSWLPSSSESTQALDKQAAFKSPNTYEAVIVYSRDSGLTDSDRAKIAADAPQYSTVGNLDGEVSGPTFSQDGKAGQVIVPLNLGHNGWNKADDIATSIRTIASGDPGLVVHVTGPIGFAADSADAFKGLDSSLLFAALAVVIVILLFTYRSPILWLLPVLATGGALGVAQGFIYLLTKAGLTVNGQSYGILTVLVFGAGTDYALLLIARYREELRRHHDRHEAMALALHRAGPAIIASGGTVILGMLCLTFAEMNSTRGLGPVAAIGVAIALLSLVTFLPALLVCCGRWVFWPRKPVEGSSDPTTTGVWSRVGQAISRHPRRVWVVTAIVLGAFAFGVLDLNAHGLTNKESFRKTVDSVVGESVLAKHFPAGSGTPVVVLAPETDAAKVHDAFVGTSGITDVTQPVFRNNEAYLQGTLTAPPDSKAAYRTIDRVRTAVHKAGTDVKVGGGTAINLDVNRATSHDSKVIIPIVLAVVFLILALLLRAIVAPVILIATVVLSFGTALGISALFFNHVFNFGGADTSLPLFVFVFLVALGIDYNIFLMTRVREESAKHGTRQGALIGLSATGGVITSAGLVLAGTFAVLATLPLTGFAEIGFAVALGVLLDTIIVRSVLVTSLTLDIGRYMWWPSALWHRREGDTEALPRPRPETLPTESGVPAD
jgi:RND superfamily putative drug exporter